uniref:Uncharacterized protein n=1 Tax=Schistosoma japonicum TaxID=6182 RepID=C1LIH2_SCHJA|nr:hypothetical protein [Schistosoma japonicum]CAX74501.1 hypothetical protein [Schistosoma japonicum]
MKQIICQLPSIKFQDEICEELLNDFSGQPKHAEASQSIVVQVPTINDFSIKSCDLSPRSINLCNTPKHLESHRRRFNTPCSGNIILKYSNVPVDKVKETEQKQQQQQQKLFPNQSIVEIGKALSLWRKIHKIHQQIDNIQKSREKQHHVRQLRLCHLRKCQENFIKRDKRITVLQKQRSIEKIQLNKQKLEQTKSQNKLIEKLKFNREKFKSLENYHKELRKYEKLTKNHMNHEKYLLDREIFNQEKYQKLINLQNRTNEIRSLLNESILMKKQNQHKLSSEIHWNRLCEKLNIESSIQERKINELKSTNEHVKELRNQKLYKIPIIMKFNNLTLNNNNIEYSM